MNYGYSYEYPVSGGSSSTLAAVILTVYLVVIAVVLAVTLASYIFHSIGLYTIGKRMGKEHAWLAFIPFARDYFHGDLAGEIPLKNKSISSPGIWKLVLPIIYGAVEGVLFVFLFVAAIGAGAASSINGNHMNGIMAFSTTLITLYVVILVAAVAYSAVYSVLRILIDIQIYERFTTRNMAVVHSVLSALVPLYEAVCFFVMRNKPFQPGMEPRIAHPPVPPAYPGGPAPGEIPHPEGPVPEGFAPGSMPHPDGPVPGETPHPAAPLPEQQENKTE